ncbi:MAG: DegV family protein [Anaerolineales bacterium]|nr:DegV family protein [Chloroflexota bacterium]MBL6980723.1 DegV family protein [Anaerolineales bacterium]
MKIAIVTDSTADIPQGIASQHNIEVIPAIIVMEGKSFEDGKGLSRQEFYEKMPTLEKLPTTATPSSGTFHKIYEKLFLNGTQSILSLHVASQLSGIYNTAKMAAQTFGERVHVIDSKSISMGLGFQVIAAAEATAEKLSAEKIIQRVKDIQRNVRVIAMLDTLENIRRSGRVSWATARIGSLLRIKLFVEVKDGAVLNLGQSRTRRKGVEHLKQLIQELGTVERLAILHSNAEADARQMLAELNLDLPKVPHVVNITPVIGTHVGANGLGVAAVLK